MPADLHVASVTPGGARIVAPPAASAVLLARDHTETACSSITPERCPAQPRGGGPCWRRCQLCRAAVATELRAWSAGGQRQRSRACLQDTREAPGRDGVDCTCAYSCSRSYRTVMCCRVRERFASQRGCQGIETSRLPLPGNSLPFWCSRHEGHQIASDAVGDVSNHGASLQIIC